MTGDPDGTDLATPAVKGAAVTLAAQAAKLALQFAAIVVMARLLSPADFGLVAIAVSIVGISEILRDFGLSTAAIQAESLDDRQRTNLFWVNSALGLACGGIVILLAPVVTSWLDEPAVGPIMIALASVYVLNGMSTQFVANLTRNLKFRSLALATVVSQALGVGSGIVLAFRDGGYWSLVVQQILTAFTWLAACVWLNGWLPSWPRRGVPIAGFMRFGGATVLSKSLSYIAKNVDNVVLGAVGGAGAVGYYSRAYQLVSVPLDQVNNPLTRVALPILSRVRSDHGRYSRYLERSQLVACYVTTTCLALVAGLAGPLVEILLGADWYPVAPILSVLAVGGAFRSMAQVNYWVYLSMGLAGAQLRFYIASQSFIVFAILVGVQWGALGVAVGGSVGYLAFWLGGLWHSGRVSGISMRPLFCRSMRALAFVAIPMGAVSYFTSTFLSNPWTSVAVGLLAGLLYLQVICLILSTVRRDVLATLSYARRAFQVA